MPNSEIKQLQANSGRCMGEDGTLYNLADQLNAIYNALTVNNDAGVQLNQANAVGGASVTPDDSSDLPTTPTKGIYVGIGGDLKVKMSDDTIITFVSLSAGMIHPISVKRVYATGTAATNILAVY
jgi:hypothetical protein